MMLNIYFIGRLHISAMLNAIEGLSLQEACDPAIATYRAAQVRSCNHFIPLRFVLDQVWAFLHIHIFSTREYGNKR